MKRESAIEPRLDTAGHGSGREVDSGVPGRARLSSARRERCEHPNGALRTDAPYLAERGRPARSGTDAEAGWGFSNVPVPAEPLRPGGPRSGAVPGLSSRWARCALGLAFLVLLLGSGVQAQTIKRAGRVQWSNGETVEGLISLSPGAQLKMHINGDQIRTLSLDRVREIRFAPETEELERKWRFAEAGQTRKEFFGKPYPIRSLTTTLILPSNEKIVGHLYTTVMYIEGKTQNSKVILLAKQKGKEGETMESLLYPSQIVFTDAAVDTEETIRVRLASPGPEKAALTAVTWGALMTFDAKKTDKPDEFTMPSPLGNGVFFAQHSGDKITVGWPKAVDEKLLALVRTNMTYTEDFYDDRQVLAVYLDQPKDDVYSVTMMWRKGATTGEGAKTQPWRLVVQRWKIDEKDQRLMLAGRGFFFRGILTKTEKPPAVEFTEQLWSLKKAGDVWQVGTATP